mgnify:CR=1 FL=1
MSKIIDFKAKPFFTTKRHYNSCPHNRITVDEENRKKECEDCGTVLDPLDYLLTIAYKENACWERYIKYEGEVQKLQKRYNNLNKEIERLTKIRNKLKLSTK